MSVAQRAQLIAGGCAAAVSLLIASEGWLPRPAPDPVGKLTACAGVTEGIQRGKTYTDDECLTLTLQALTKRAVAIEPCIRVDVPIEARAAFYDFSYNAGPAAFCGSTMARKLNTGDLAGACAELSRWTSAGGHVLPGLVKRRAAERSLCERAITP